MQDCSRRVPIEQFSASDLSCLREDLLRSGMDSRQVTEMIRSFLAERGYGVLLDEVYSAATSFGFRVSLKGMQETLERLAVLM